MIRASTAAALALSTILLGACQVTRQQTPPPATGTAMDGSWASTDGVFVASFQGGSFTSRFVKTNEVLAQGTYSLTGAQVAMQWLSVATQEQRSASCSFTGANDVHCEQAGGGGFELRRTA
jgi:aspartate ammonia-lyase